ncbi:hypothetical protein Tco_1299540 [Tanacetum coccineum]
MNATGTSTSQRSTNVVVGTRKRLSDAGTTPSTAPTKKKQATRSSNARTTPSTTSAKKKHAPTGSGQNRMTRACSAAAKKQTKMERPPFRFLLTKKSNPTLFRQPEYNTLDSDDV